MGLVKNLILLGFECLSVVLPAALVFFVYRGSGTAVKWRHLLAIIVLAVYLSAVLAVTSSGTIYDAVSSGGSYARAWGRSIMSKINYIPFSQENHIMQYVLNVIMLMPFGFLLPAIWRRTNKIWCIALSGFSLSLLIELSQMLNHRRSDVDDLIMNTLGAVLGLLLFRAFFKLTGWRGGREDYTRLEPLLYVVAMFFGHFFLFDQFGLIQILYGK